MFGVYFKGDDLVSFLLYTDATMQWLPASISNVQNSYKSVILTYIDYVKHGFGQIYACNIPLGGLIVIIANFTNSSRIGVHVLVANLMATLSARPLGFARPLIASGLYRAVVCDIFSVALIKIVHPYSVPPWDCHHGKFEVLYGCRATLGDAPSYGLNADDFLKLVMRCI